MAECSSFIPVFCPVYIVLSEVCMGFLGKGLQTPRSWRVVWATWSTPCHSHLIPAFLELQMYISAACLVNTYCLILPSWPWLVWAKVFPQPQHQGKYSISSLSFFGASMISHKDWGATYLLSSVALSCLMLYVSYSKQTWHQDTWKLLPVSVSRSWQTFLDEPESKYLRLAGHVVSVATTNLCKSSHRPRVWLYCNKVLFPKFVGWIIYIWLTGHSFPTLVIYCYLIFNF